MELVDFVVALYRAEITADFQSSAFVTHGFGTFAVLVVSWCIFCSLIDLVRHPPSPPSSLLFLILFFVKLVVVCRRALYLYLSLLFPP